MSLKTISSINKRRTEGVETMREVFSVFILIMSLVLVLSFSASSCSGGGSDQPDGDEEVDTDETTDGDVDVDEAKPDGDTEEDVDIDIADGDKEIDQVEEIAEEEEEEALPSGSLQVSPSPVVFDPTNFSQTSSVTVTMTNNAAANSENIEITHIELTNSTSSAIALQNCSADQTLSVGQKYTCNITCTPQSVETHTGQLRVLALSDNGDPLEQRVDISCSTLINVLAVNDAAIEFGNVDPGKALHKFFSFTNAGLMDLTVTEVAFTEDSSDTFSIVETSRASLAGTYLSGAGQYFEIRFNPTTDGLFIGWLKISSNEMAQTRLIPVTGRTSKDCPDNTIKTGDNSCAETCIAKLHQCTDQDSYKVCSDSGNAWGEVQDCPENTQCVDGYCVLAECQKDVSFCKNNKYFTCGEYGESPTQSADCTDDQYCSNICIPNEGCKYPETNNYCNDLNPCTDDVCTKGAGCEYSNNTGSCNDDNPCTENDSCLRGSCVGQLIKCDDENQCTKDYCDETLGCQFDHITGPCNDNNACTINEQCIEGNCTGETRVCNDGSDCTTDTCDTTLGCVFTPTGLSCDDGNPCTVNDTCSTEKCKGIEQSWDDGLYCNGPNDQCDPDLPVGENIIHPNPVVCNDNISCTVDDHCDEDQDSCVFTPDDTKCDDGNPCTVNTCDTTQGCITSSVANHTTCDIIAGVDEICINGVCVIGCSDDWECQDGISCTSDYCDKSIGYCVHETNDDYCSNGLFCDGKEVCNLQKGCIAGDTPGCSDGFACTLDICDEDTDTCRHVARDSHCNDYNDCTVNICKSSEGCVFPPREGSCDDNNPCTLNDMCENGTCIGGGTFLDCDDNNLCTDDKCVAGVGCQYNFNVESCDDNDACTEQDRCVEGTCIGSSAECDDGYFCNGAETCSIDGCQSGEAIQCDDKIECTIDKCSEDMFGCEFTPDDSRCDDYNPCTENDRCTLTGCKADNVEDGTACGEEGSNMACYNGNCVIPCEKDEDCDDEILCTTDICDSETQYCKHTPENSNCSDSLYCNGYEICDLKQGCIAGTPPDCDDEVDCTIDDCNEDNNTCTHEASNELCTAADQCHAGICNADTGCSYVAVAKDCDDNNTCTVNDYCVNGICKGDENTCEDYNPCTTNFCTLNDGCTSKNVQNGIECGSGIIPRVCMDGKCVEGCINDQGCDDGIECTVDACNPLTRQCSHTAFDDFCDDGYKCNGQEICNVETGCESGTPLDCNDYNPCTEDSCNPITGVCNNVYAFEGQSCEDRDVCSTSSICNYFCQSVETRQCPQDSNECTTAFCDSYYGCSQQAVADGTSCGSGGICKNGYCSSSCTGACNDQNACTENDICDENYCTGTPINCNDDNACTNDSCDIVTGCVNDIVADDLPCMMENGNPGKCSNGTCIVFCTTNAECDDSIGCTEDICTDTGCVHNFDDSQCNDNNECTNNTCTATGCTSSYNTNICNDGNKCTEGDVCNNGTCAGTLITVNDNNKCTNDFCDAAFGEYHVDISSTCTTDNQCLSAICDPESGCKFVEIKAPCDDGNACTLYDTCNLGECNNSIPLNCDDYNECTIDDCDMATGCTHTPVEDLTVCRIINAIDGVCINGACISECEDNTDCTDTVSCTDDICNTETGLCEHVLHDDQCDDGVFCNGAEQCKPFYGCISGKPVDCNDDVDCTTDSCNEDTNSCVNSPVNNICNDDNPCTSDTCDVALGCQNSNLTGNSCDDGLRCTNMDTCDDGTCKGVQISCDDNNSCTSPDLCDETLGCLNFAVEDNTECLGNGICKAGQCLTLCEYDFECDDGIDCTVDFCDNATGRCRNNTNNNYCNDGFYCNGIETCHAAFGCIPGKPVQCNDGLPCTTDYCDEEEDQCSVEANDTLCNDGNPCTRNKCDPQYGCYTDDSEVIKCDDGNKCTLNDYCIAGQCQGDEGEPDCAEGITYERCAAYDCYELTGCVTVYKNDKACDGGACAIQSYCKFGHCVTTVEKYCSGTNPCIAYSCHPIEGCKETPTDGVSCDDNNACTVFDTCNVDSCEGTTRDCDDQNPCTSDDCDPQTGCTHASLANDTPCTLAAGGDGVCRNGYCSASCTGDCSDDNACTENDACVSGYCQGDVINCDDGNPCTVNSCDTETGCTSADLADNTACILDNKAGECIAGNCAVFCENNADCDDQNPCTTDTCDPAVGCSYEFADNIACDPNNSCANAGQCFQGVCSASSFIQCDDQNSCTTDSCDPETGCVFENIADDTSCDDQNPCTQNDVCTAGICGGTTTNCDDQNPCTHDICNSSGSCDNIELSGNACDDGNLCTSDSICILGKCTAIANTDCNDDDPCTTDRCYPDSGCDNTGTSGNTCNDDNVCTFGEVCDAGSCVPGSYQLDCDDDDPCTADICDSELGCTNPPMQNGDVCDVDPNVREICESGNCIEYCESNNDCNDSIDCTIDNCNLDSHTCSFTTDHIYCDDGIYCNGAEFCDFEQGCMSGNVPLCDDEISCTDDLCNTQSDSCVNVPQDFLCDDGEECSLDICNENTGCEYEQICSQ